MSNKTPAGAAIEPLWTGEQIRSAIQQGWKEHGYTYHYDWIHQLVSTIRDDCEVAATAQHEQLQQRVQELTDALRASNKLINGELEQDKRIAELLAERDALAAEVAAVRGQLARCSELYDKRKGEMWQLEQDLDALAAEVERLRAGSYQPVPNGYNTGRIGNYEIQIGLDSGKLHIFNIRKNRMCWTVDLPAGIDLCQWQPAQDTQPGDGQEGVE